MRHRFTSPPDPIPASPLCQVVTGDNGGCRVNGFTTCDCRHVVRRRGGTQVWAVAVDSFTGIAVTYFPIDTEEPTRELITEPELARLL
jgi:hypothetical protein